MRALEAASFLPLLCLAEPGLSQRPLTMTDSERSAPIRFARFCSPCGELLLGGRDGSLLFCDWAAGWHADAIRRRIDRLAGPRREEVALADDPLLERATTELEAYFSGGRRDFDLPLALLGTAFQQRVWRTLLSIPFGRLATYGDVARAAGSPGAVRAAGVAVGENPFSILIPCHRVIGRNGSITGYGGGFAAKRRLLELEGFALSDAKDAKNERLMRVLASPEAFVLREQARL